MKFFHRLALFLAAPALLSAAEVAKVATIAPAEAAKLVTAGKAVLVDVREPQEWAQTGVAQPAVLLAKSDFDGAQKDWKPFLASVGSKQVILYCRTGHRSGLVADELARKGVNVANAGALKDWVDAGLPVRKVEPAK
ncbi:MAG TPA: rhodanese-like domain-containing protein [Opitutaceae bacterium]|nr:rhodanese-like domain-containing protein [Opitutaceae bacterium]